MSLIKLALAGAAAYALYKYATRNEHPKHAAFATGEGSNSNFAKVRNSGPEAMRDTPKRWSKTDEELDQSFPASDPPGNY